jgi:hypothetical protein
MNKGVLIGGGAGLMVLGLLGAYWLMASGPQTPSPAESKPAPMAIAPLAPPTSGTPEAMPSPTPPAVGASENTSADAPAEPGTSAPLNASPTMPAPESGARALTREERRKIRAEVRRKMTELLAKGQNAQPADTLAFLDDVEKSGQGVFDPRYFSTLREMVGYSAKTQALSKELAQIANSKTPQAEARRQDILAEMRDLGDRFSKGASALQTYAHDAIAAGKP